MFDERSPIYRQIAARIRDEVLRGELGPDERVMSTNEYAAFYRINPATAAKAFAELVDEGVLYKRRGVGMFVHAGAAERLRTARRERFLTDVVEPMLVQARLLDIPIDEIVAHLRAAEPADAGTELS